MEGIEELINLQHLNLSLNQITSIPSSETGKLINLRELYLCGNQIRSIPQSETEE